MSNRPELDTVLRQLEAEMAKRQRAEEERDHLKKVLHLNCNAHACADLALDVEEPCREQPASTGNSEEVRHLQEELAKQKKALEVANHELESLCYSISHDLRAPLRHLLGFSSVLLEDYRESLDPAAQSYLDCIARAGRKMDVQVEALLNLSRIARQELRIDNVDLSKIARECAASLQEAHPERSVSFSVAENLRARADATLLKTALGDLLGNAWKYTGKKERATVEFGRTKDGDATVFYLRDNGAGFDMRYADRLFGPFQRMHKESEFEGVGVGLAAVQRIVHRHGGRIWADATVDGGATFFFTLAD